jgi:hypothetical protein
VCEGAEDGTNCAIDCGQEPSCGDGTCDSIENCDTCPLDCAQPEVCDDDVDNDCDGLIDCEDTADCDCSCLPKGSPCSSDSECCTNKCRGGKCR